MNQRNLIKETRKPNRTTILALIAASVMVAAPIHAQSAEPDSGKSFAFSSGLSAYNQAYEKARAIALGS